MMKITTMFIGMHVCIYVILRALTNINFSLFCSLLYSFHFNKYFYLSLQKLLVNYLYLLLESNGMYEWNYKFCISKILIPHLIHVGSCVRCPFSCCYFYWEYKNVCSSFFVWFVGI